MGDYSPNRDPDEELTLISEDECSTPDPNSTQKKTKVSLNTRTGSKRVCTLKVNGI